ncbi:hypothetical protein PDQ79_23570 [Bacillus cereus]|nr:hypothetical protein [Bacillus cereus]
MNKCTFCGRESDFHDTKIVGGYEILTCCTDCEEEIYCDQDDQEDYLFEQEQQEIIARAEEENWREANNMY